MSETTGWKRHNGHYGKLIGSDRYVIYLRESWIVLKNMEKVASRRYLSESKRAAHDHARGIRP